MQRKWLCPSSECGTDVMVTGFTLRAETTESYMRFRGRGPILISSTQLAAKRAECMVCGTKLPWAPTELMQAA